MSETLLHLLHVNVTGWISVTIRDRDFEFVA